MDVRKLTRAKNKIYRETKSNMEQLGVFKTEFDPSVKRYAELRVQFDALNAQWYDDGCKITEEYTNKAGAKNQRKTALYLSLEALRRELTDMENLFGLTPKGLKMIKTKGLDKVKGTALDKALEKLNE